MWNFSHFKVQWVQVMWHFCVVLRFNEHNISLLRRVYSWTVIHTMYISLPLWTLILCGVYLWFCSLILWNVWCQPSVLYSDLTDCVMSAFSSGLWSCGQCDVNLRFCTYRLCNVNFRFCALQKNPSLLGCNIQSHLKKKKLICWNFINLGMAGVIPQETEMYTTVFEYFNSTAVFR